jgi:hypothetical protein
MVKKIIKNMTEEKNFQGGKLKKLIWHIDQDKFDKLKIMIAEKASAREILSFLEIPYPKTPQIAQSLATQIKKNVAEARNRIIDKKKETSPKKIRIPMLQLNLIQRATRDNSIKDGSQVFGQRATRKEEIAKRKAIKAFLKNK